MIARGLLGHWLFATSAERRLLPDARLNEATPWVLAIMMFVTVTVAAAALALANGARLVAAGVEHRYTLQLDGGPAAAVAVAPAIARIGGVTSVRSVGEEDMRRTLERWLGSAALADELELPGLVELELAPGASAQAVASAAARRWPGARLIAHGETLQPLLASLRALRLLAWGLVLLMAAATAAAVVLAARGALDTNRATIDVLHGIGATDRQIVRLFERRIAIDALVGGLAGALAAGAVLALILGGSAALVDDLAGGPALRPADVALLALLPLAGALLATLVARAAVLRALRRAL